ncbi:MAG: hypothetical protein Q9218_004504 [Villophora microphyllina]
MDSRKVFQLPFRDIRYSLHPLYHAMVVIVDRIWKTSEGYEIEPHGLESLYKFAVNQTVLIARTGVAKGLSEPISFECLEAQSFPLNVSSSDKNLAQDGDVIRVSLATAVRFIVDLEAREDLAASSTRSDSYDMQHDHSLDPPVPKGHEDNPQVRIKAETWVDTTIALAERCGYYNTPETWESIHKMQAASVGEDHYKLILTISPPPHLYYRLSPYPAHPSHPDMCISTSSQRLNSRLQMTSP